MHFLSSQILPIWKMSPSCPSPHLLLCNPYYSNSQQEKSHLLHPLSPLVVLCLWGRSCLLAPLFLASILSETEKGILTWLFWCESLEMTAFKGNIVFENYQALCEADFHTHCVSDVTGLHLANPSMSQPPASPVLTYCPRGTLVPPFSSPPWAPVPEGEMWGGPAKIRRACLKCLLGRIFGNGLF